MLLGVGPDGPVGGRRVVITGMGIVACCGTGLDAFWEGLHRPASDGERRVSDFDPSAWFGPKEVRRVDRFAQFSVAAADMALLETPVPGIPGHRGMSETMGQHQLVEERVRDVDTGEDLPEMAEGELVIRGPGLMAAYYKQEREEVFGADGWFHTGDRVFQHEGRAYFVGRYTEIIKSRGANVSPSEVELALETFPEILHAFVVGLPHAEHGEEVVAVLVAADGAEIDPEAVRRQAREDLSSFKVPTRIEVWPVEEIPWLPSHKPDKLKIRAALEQ